MIFSRTTATILMSAVATLAMNTEGLAQQRASTVPSQMDAARYDRAIQFNVQRVAPLALNIRIIPHWRGGLRERFSYRREIGEGRAQFLSVDAATGKQSPAFDPKLIAVGLGAATGGIIDPERLPFYDYDETSTGIRFSFGPQTWDCMTAKPACTDAGVQAVDPMAVPSPDGKWQAYVDKGNLWVRSTDGTSKFALTSDAEPRNGYAANPESSYTISVGGPFRAPPGQGTSRIGPPAMRTPPALIWSPDSSMIFTNRLDERAVRDKSITQNVPQDGTVGPITWTWKSAQPNDPALPMAESWLFDVSRKLGRKLAIDLLPISFFSPQSDGTAWWTPDSKQINLITRTRYAKSMTLNFIDAVTGAVRSPVTENAKTFIEPSALGERPLTQVLLNGDVLWFSERTGFGHLYLYDGKTGTLKRALTKGNWTVRNILRLDEAKGFVYIAANEYQAGDDPYWTKVYSVRLSDGRMTLLTPEAADHDVRSPQQSAGSGRATPLTREPEASYGFSPSGNYFLDAYGRFDLPTQFVLRTTAGRKIANVDTTDVSRLTAIGWTPPERFSALAADGKTVLYGMLWKPTDFDPSKSYPLLDSIYPGPQTNRVKPSFTQALLDNASSKAWAELGMIVFSVDGRGTPERSKMFRDYSYAALGNAGALEDHIAVTKQLAARYSWIDTTRIGMYGGSGGAYATTHALFTYPDFYRAGVSDAGNHDQRLYVAVWGETYNGPEVGDNYTKAANQLLAQNLKGKLMLIHGDMDSNVLPGQTLQVAAALMKANKNFEMLITPNYGHVSIAGPGYPLRRAWDFIVKNLIGVTPPDGFEFKPAKTAK